MARGDGGAQFARAPARVNAPDVMSAEDEKSPTIFEAAADEEITESHWCVRANPPRAENARPRPTLALPRRDPSRARTPRRDAPDPYPNPGRAGNTTAAGPATTARATPCTPTSRTSPCATACPCARAAAAILSGCGRRNRERRPRRTSPPGGGNVARRGAYVGTPAILFETRDARARGSISRFDRSHASRDDSLGSPRRCRHEKNTRGDSSYSPPAEHPESASRLAPPSLNTAACSPPDLLSCFFA